MMSKIPSKEQVAETPVHKTTTNTKKKRRGLDSPDSYKDGYTQHITNCEQGKGTIRTYSYEEISQHSTANDLWMVLHGNVYDVTSVVDSHPGGAEVLIDCGGMDATIAFDEVGHSSDSVLMLDPLFMGIVDEDGALDSAVNGMIANISSQRRNSQSPANWEYTRDHGDGDGAIKNYKTGRVENVSLGESQYLRRIRMKKKKKKWLKDEQLLVLLSVLALCAAFAYVCLKWMNCAQY